MSYKQPETMPVINELYKITKDGRLFDHKNHIIYGYHSNGYHCYKLQNGLPKRKSFLAHRLVWEAWVGPIPKGYWINHEDGNKSNNDLSNLKCETPTYNHRHARDVLKRTWAAGTDGVGIITLEARECMKLLKANGWTQEKISRVWGVSLCTVSRQLNKVPRG